MRRTFPSLAVLCLTLLASPLRAADATDDAVKAIRAMCTSAKTFEVEIVHANSGGRQHVRTYAAYRGVDLCRMQFWTQDASKERVVQALAADRLYARGQVTELKGRTVDQWAVPKYFFLNDYRLFPLYVDQAFRKCKVDYVLPKGGAIEIRWLNPEGNRDKFITARFAAEQPHDILSVGTSTTPGDAYETEIVFSEHTDAGGGFRFPAKMDWTVRNAANGETRSYPSSARLLRANEELPDSRFILYLPKGATMPDETVTDKVIAVDGNKAGK